MLRVTKLITNYFLHSLFLESKLRVLRFFVQSFGYVDVGWDIISKRYHIGFLFLIVVDPKIMKSNGVKFSSSDLPVDAFKYMLISNDVPISLI